MDILFSDGPEFHVQTMKESKRGHKSLLIHFNNGSHILT